MEAEALLVHADFVRGLAHSLVFGSAEVDDVVQETWLSALRKPPREGPGLKTWFGTVVRNVVRQRQRGQGRREVRERAAARPEGLSSTDAILEREELRRRVVDAVLDLDDNYRDVIRLRYFEDMPPGQIALELDVPVATVKTRLQRALGQLRGRLDEQHGGDRRAWAVLLLPLTGAEAAKTAPRLGLVKAAQWAAVILVVPAIGVAVWESLDGSGHGAGDTLPVLEVSDGAPPPDDGRVAEDVVADDAGAGNPAEDRHLAGLEVDLGGRWRREYRREGFTREQQFEFNLTESVMVIDGFDNLPFLRLPNGDLHFDDGEGRTMTYRPSLRGTTLTLVLIEFKKPESPWVPHPGLIVVRDKDGNVVPPTPQPVDETAIPKVDLEEDPLEEIVLEKLDLSDAATSIVARLNDVYTDLFRAMRNAGPGGVSFGDQDMIHIGGVMRRKPALREHARPDVLLETHLAYFDGVKNPEFRHLARYVLASSPEAVRLLLDRRAWRQRTLMCRRESARVLSIAASLPVETLAASLSDPADPVILFALMAKTGHTFGSPPRYLLEGAAPVPAEVTAHWREWLEAEWPKRSRMKTKERSRAEEKEIRTLIASPDPLEVKRGLERYAALFTCEFSAYMALLEKLRAGEFEAIDRDMKIMVFPYPARWGHRWF